MDLREWYRTLIRLRRTSPTLIDGGFQVLVVEQDTLVYQRDTDEEIILVVAHRGEQVRSAGQIPVAHAAIPDQAEFEELFSHERIRVAGGSFPLPAMHQGAQVWVARNLHL
jgi:alpha-glucosidase